MPAGLGGHVLTGALRPTVDDAAKRREAWEFYRDLVSPTAGSDQGSANAPSVDERYPRTIYVHVVEGEGHSRLALQFWAFYFFNDWWNVHEADWECVTLFFADLERTPRAAAYSAHFGSLWRAWSDLATRSVNDEVHPLVYVARGSHANYFGPKAGGYEVSGTVTIRPRWWRLDIRGAWARPSGRKKDFVPAVQQATAAAAPEDRVFQYRLVALPGEDELVDPADDPAVWSELWWLRMAARWDSGGTIDGPMKQAERWRTPYSWVRESGHADARWDAVFDRVAPVTTLTGSDSA